MDSESIPRRIQYIIQFTKTTLRGFELPQIVRTAQKAPMADIKDKKRTDSETPSESVLFLIGFFRSYRNEYNYL